jgi:hypothetical protein
LTVISNLLVLRAGGREVPFGGAFDYWMMSLGKRASGICGVRLFGGKAALREVFVPAAILTGEACGGCRVADYATSRKASFT